MSSNHYPLQWPPGWPRHKAEDRKRGQFGTTARRNWKTPITISEGISRVLSQLGKLTKVGQEFRVPPDSIVISCDIPMRKSDGMPYSNAKEPNDPGVAVYFNLDGEPKCLPCDTYNRVADNLAAIAAHIDSLRTMERHGVLDVKAMMNARPALPEKTGLANMPWWGVLNVPEKAGMETINYSYRNLLKVWHPDIPGTGDRAKYDELQRAYEEARRARQA